MNTDISASDDRFRAFDSEWRPVVIDRLFLEHPRAVDESYGEHMRAAGGFGVVMIVAGFACLVHALVPGLFVSTGSKAIDRLHDKMVRNRRRRAAPSAERLVRSGNEAA